jgi:hypothetical protein
MSKRFFGAGLVMMLVVALFAGSASSAIIGLKPTDSSILNSDGDVEVLVCTEFEVDLYVEDLAQVPNVDSANPLVAFTLGVDWDDLVSFEKFTPNRTWWSTIDVDPPPGPGVIPDEVALKGYAATVAPSDDHIIGTFLLHCVDEGKTTLTPLGQIPAPFNFALADGTFIDEHIVFENLTIKQVVPIPSTLLLLGSGVMGLVAMRRRNRNR